MSDPWDTADAGASGGAYWKPAEYEGAIHVFMGGQKMDGTNSFGNEYSLCQFIWLPESNDVYQGDYAEVSQALLRHRVASKPIIIGRVEKVKTDQGREAWGITDVDEKEKDAARKAWAKVFTMDQAGRFTMATDPQEAPF
jgi:hypothetical protein